MKRVAALAVVGLAAVALTTCDSGPTAGELTYNLSSSNTNDGAIHCLSKDGKKWEAAGKQHLARFVPRLLAGEKGELIVVGGSSPKGEPREVEVIAPK